jgi:hypothetical protein
MSDAARCGFGRPTRAVPSYFQCRRAVAAQRKTITYHVIDLTKTVVDICFAIHRCVRTINIIGLTQCGAGDLQSNIGQKICFNSKPPRTITFPQKIRISEQTHYYLHVAGSIGPMCCLTADALGKQCYQSSSH